MRKNIDSDAVVAPAVPDELWFAVFVGALDESEAIERGRRAAQAQTEEERYAILFATTTQRPPMPLPTGPMPWFEP